MRRHTMIIVVVILKKPLLVAGLLLVVKAFGASAPKVIDIVQKHDVALATTTYELPKPHAVTGHWKLATIKLKVIPYVIERGSSKLELGVRFRSSFVANAMNPDRALIIVADG